MQAKLNAIAKGMAAEIPKALFQEASIEMTESKRRVPVDTGVLRASGFVDKPELKGGVHSITMAYGGAASEYALIVHEDLTAFHPHGEAKYLESVLRESEPFMAGRIAARLALNKVGK
jgi:hypothetical protein